MPSSLHSSGELRAAADARLEAEPGAGLLGALAHRPQAEVARVDRAGVEPPSVVAHDQADV